MKILVTGGAGFIGTNLCLRLMNDGHEVYCYDNLYSSTLDNVDVCRNASNSYHYFNVDVRLNHKFHQIDFDRVYHLACPASPPVYQKDQIYTMTTSFVGSNNVFRTYGKKARILLASTSEIYGDPEIHPQKEIYFGNVNSFGARSCYDEGKRSSEALAYSYIDQYGCDIRVARIFNTHGPYMDLYDGRVVTNFIGQVLRNEPLTIYGDGTQTRSLCYVSDTVSGLIKLMECPREKFNNTSPIVNLGNPEEKTISEIATSILHKMKSHNDIIYKPLPSDDPLRRRPDITKAEEILGWSPSVSFDTGIDKTIEWFYNKRG